MGIKRVLQEPRYRFLIVTPVTSS